MKTPFKVYKLHFTSPIHIGDERLDYGSSQKYLHSDSMYAALTSILASVGYEIPKNGDLGFQISSLFPFYQKSNDDKSVYFFPKLKKQGVPPTEFQGIAKQMKKIEWIDLDSFNRLVDGENYLYANLAETKESLKSNFFTKETLPTDGFIHSEVAPRVQVPRYGIEGAATDAEPFYMERVFFKEYSGLFFIAVGDNLDLLDKALQILKDEGIGTDRTVGQGFFDFETDTIEINHVDSKSVTNLSLFCPESKDQLSRMLDDNEGQVIAYDFKKRGGWITTAPFNTFRKNSVYMFTEGSVFNHSIITSAFSMGAIVDLKPDSVNGLNHPVFRSGKAIFIPVKI